MINAMIIDELDNVGVVIYPIKKGDTIVTGGQSVIFPENIGIGTIANIYTEKETNYYKINIKLFNDMTNLGHVYIIKSKNREELINLEKREKNE